MGADGWWLLCSAVGLAAGLWFLWSARRIEADLVAGREAYGRGEPWDAMASQYWRCAWDHAAGEVAARRGEPRDASRSEAWREGWDEAEADAKQRGGRR